MTMNSYGSAVLAANRILDRYDVKQDDLLLFLDEIVREREALIVYEHLDGAEARLNLAGKPAIITISTAIKNPQRKRFNIAHELGHLELHRYLMTLCTSDDINSWYIKQSDKNHEQEASEFAAAFLMPERFFAALCEEEPSCEYFADLARKFHTSLTSASLRYANFTPEPIAIVFSEDGYIKWFKSSKEFEELELFVAVGGRLSRDTRASLFFQGKTTPKTPANVEVSSWCKPGNYPKDAVLQEQSWVVSDNMVLSLLWVDTDFEDDF